MNLAEAYFVFVSRQCGRGFEGRENILPLELKVGRLNLWATFATAFAANTGLLESIDGETATPTDLASLVRTGYITSGSRSEDAERLLMKAVEVLQAVRAAEREAYAQARPPSPDIDTANIAAKCDDGPKRPGRKKMKGSKNSDDDT